MHWTKCTTEAQNFLLHGVPKHVGGKFVQLLCISMYIPVHVRLVFYELIAYLVWKRVWSVITEVCTFSLAT